jgi:hypothetical protein
MKKKFQRTYAELKHRVSGTGIRGHWRDRGNHKQFRTENGAILNWWETTGTINFQGQVLVAQELEGAFLRATGSGAATSSTELPYVRSVQDLQEENAQLKELLCQKMLESAMLKERISGK